MGDVFRDYWLVMIGDKGSPDLILLIEGIAIDVTLVSRMDQIWTLNEFGSNIQQVTTILL